MTGSGYRVVRAEVRTEHPSTDLFGALNERQWEALAVAAAENIATAPGDPASVTRLQEMGLLLEVGLPLAAGYALLLSWHRRSVQRKGGWRWPWSPSLTRHEIRMRTLWAC